MDSNINIFPAELYSCQPVEKTTCKSFLQRKRICIKKMSDDKDINERKMFEPSEETDHQLKSFNMDRFRHLFDSFVSSYEPERRQLGRNHPCAIPEQFEINKSGELSSDICSVISEDNRRPYYLRSISASCSVHNDGNKYLNYETLFSVDDFELSEVSSDISEDISVISEESTFPQICVYDLSGLFEILNIQSSTDMSIKEPKPHYPVGEWNFKECGICLETNWMYSRHCCQFPACDSCLEQYFASKVKQGIIQIECCNLTCHNYVHRDEISVKLHSDIKETFQKLLASTQIDKFTKPCPRCNRIITMNPYNIKNKKKISSTKIQCPDCQLEWCFRCHAPWHAKLSCKKFQKGDRLVKYWAKETNKGEPNAQRCPKCKIYIQKIDGCNQIHCTRCQTKFCYRCGDKFLKLKFFGNHDSKFSIFGCKYIYKSKKPIQRKLIRGSIFGSKVLVTSILGALALCATGFGIFVLPVYGGILYYRRRKNE